VAVKLTKIKNQVKSMEEILTKYNIIKKQIPASTHFTVVTKNQTMDKIMPLIEAGHRDFAENYVQEAQEKWVDVIKKYDINLKLIGRLQSNKINDALLFFNEIHSVHSLELAEKIASKLTNETKTQKFHLQVNIGEEDQKSGIKPEDILNFFEQSPLQISGLMCIPPANVDSSFYFLLLNNIKHEIEKKMDIQLKLNIGMSDDWQLAIKLKSDEIRIGSAIFK
jgi:pyridoxal phosphate enzyme (YggS family)